MGLSTNSAFIKIRNKVISQGISLSDIKAESFDPRDLGLTFTESEKGFLKRFWKKGWHLGMKKHLVEAWLMNHHDSLDRSVIKDAFVELFDVLASQGVSKQTAKRLIMNRLEKESE